MTTIQVRVEEKTKRQSAKIFHDLGLDLSSAINVYLRKVIATKGIPFSVLTENGMTLEEEDEILKASEEARRGINISRPLKGKAAIEYLKAVR